MASWRPVTGEILCMDPTLSDASDVQRFFDERRIPSRGVALGDDGYRVEIATTGRRRRVATIGDDGVVVPGPSLGELVEAMDWELRKLQIDLGGVIAWGDIDLGEVDVAEDDIDAHVHAVGASSGPTAVSGAASGGDALCDGAAKDGEQDAEPEIEEIDYGAGPILVVSDIPLADMPGIAAQVKRTISVLRFGGISAMLGEAEGGESARAANLGAKSSFAITLATDPTGLDQPVLSIQSRAGRLTWHWDDELKISPWTAENEEAAAFADEFLGAGAFSHRIARRVPGTDEAAVRAALEGPSEAGPSDYARALGLPEEVPDFLCGLIDATVVPGVVVFEPRKLGQRLQTSVAYELVGEGKSKTGIWPAYRKIFVDHPRITEVVASIQASIGGAVLVSGVRSRRGLGGKIAIVTGGAMVVNAVGRILATQWLQAALRTEGLSVPRGGDDEVEEN